MRPTGTYHRSLIARHCFLVRRGLRRWMHAMLWHFMDATRRRLNPLPVEMVERYAAFPDGIGLLDRFRRVCFRECRCFKQSPAYR